MVCFSLIFKFQTIYLYPNFQFGLFVCNTLNGEFIYSCIIVFYSKIFDRSSDKRAYKMWRIGFIICYFFDLFIQALQFFNFLVTQLCLYLVLCVFTISSNFEPNLLTFTHLLSSLYEHLSSFRRYITKRTQKIDIS